MLHTSPLLGFNRIVPFQKWPSFIIEKKSIRPTTQFSNSHLSQEESTSFYESKTWKYKKSQIEMQIQDMMQIQIQEMKETKKRLKRRIFVISPSTSCCLLASNSEAIRASRDGSVRWWARPGGEGMMGWLSHSDTREPSFFWCECKVDHRTK